jgi:hypothetical protein
VLLAGTKRIVPPEARVRVHQIWLGDRRDDAAAASYTAEDLVLVQRDIGKLAQYTIEMGGSVELLEVSLRIPPWEPMRALSRDELRRMNLDNSEFADARPVATLAAANAAPPQNPVKRAATIAPRERGWVVAERAGVTTLTRKHPLTVEGEDLGTIEVSFACGASPDEFVVLYTEMRRVSNAAAQPLKSVELRLANKVVPLTLAALPAAPNAGERVASASGTVSATVLQSFASSGLRSLVIEAASENSDLAVVRIGNTGAAANLSQFIAGCTQPVSASAEHAVLQADPQ